MWADRRFIVPWQLMDMHLKEGLEKMGDDPIVSLQVFG
jgi:hypothetical protein